MCHPSYTESQDNQGRFFSTLYYSFSHQGWDVLKIITELSLNKLDYFGSTHDVRSGFVFPLRALRFTVKLLWLWIYMPFAEEDLST